MLVVLLPASKTLPSTLILLLSKYSPLGLLLPNLMTTMTKTATISPFLAGFRLARDDGNGN